MPVFVDGKRVGVTHELQEDDDWHNGYGASLAVEVGRLGAAGGGEGRMRTRPAIRTRAMGTRRGVSGMIDNGYPLRKAMDGGFRPPKEAREIEAALEGQAEKSYQQIFREVWAEFWGPTLLRWFRMQGQ